jgi:transcriptional regulator CBF1
MGGSNQQNAAGSSTTTQTTAPSTKRKRTSETEQRQQYSSTQQLFPSDPARGFAGLGGNGNYRPQGLQQPTLGDAVPQPVGAESVSPSDGNRPQVGSEEWHRQRRDNHKEVERRRRETINEGISELAKIVPNCEKNKGSILARAVQYIQQLRDQEAHNTERWTLEKLLTDQTVAELKSVNEKLRGELDRALREAEAWKKAVQQSSRDDKR